MGREPLEPGVLDSTGTTLSVPLGRALNSGLYQVLVDPDSDLADLEGNRLVTDGQPLAVGEFAVAATRGVTRDDADDLGTVTGGIVVAVTGNLDLLADPYAVALYKITLPPGVFWRLGLEVTAERDGGTLDSRAGPLRRPGPADRRRGSRPVRCPLRPVPLRGHRPRGLLHRRLRHGRPPRRAGRLRPGRRPGRRDPGGPGGRHLHAPRPGRSRRRPRPGPGLRRRSGRLPGPGPDRLHPRLLRGDPRRRPDR